MFKTGTVVAVYPEGNSVDVLLNNGDRLSNVQVLSPTGSSNTGILDLPDVGGPAPSDDGRWNPQASRDRYVKSMVGFCDGVPFVAGFLLPQVNQVTFKQKNRMIDRHASDVYKTIDDAGNMEIAFPNGTYFRVGTSPAHEDLSGQDYDRKWAIARNTGAALNVHLSVFNGGTETASFNINPAGNITLSHAGSLTVHTAGNASVTADGTTSVHSGGNATIQVGGTAAVTSTGQLDITAPLTNVNGPMTVNGLLTFLAGIAGTGSGGGSAGTITGNIVITSGDVIADGHTIKSHHHGGVQSGSSNTSGPTG